MGSPLFVRRWGQGPPVLFVHGLGASSRYWKPLAQVSSGYAATAPDLLGFGHSPTPPDASYDVDSHLEALVPLLPPGAVVVGHSMGAILAAALAAACPVRALLLLGLPAFPDRASARRDIGGLGLLARLTVDGSPLARWLCQAMCAVRPLASTVAPLVNRDLPRSIASDGARHTWASYHRSLERVVIEHRVLPDLVAAGAPAVLVHGRLDRAAPLNRARALAHEARGAGVATQLEVVSGDHHLALRCPEAVAAALADLVAKADHDP
ncbi:MAG: alpha/beta hydrolase [Actinomycetota bacterium]|nr:alpha/beta hydrolase [Actinomycetota bacterium]